MTLRGIAAPLAAIGFLTASLGLAQAQAAPMPAPTPPSCAQGGVCQIGDTGPAGGTVIYVGASVIDVAAPISAGGRYLEAAPADWYQGGDFMGEWCIVNQGQAFSVRIGTAAEIGTGANNTLKMSRTCTPTGGLGTIANLSLNGYSDWFLPSQDELLALVSAGVELNEITTNCFGGSCYWSSTESPDSNDIAKAINNGGGWIMGNNSKAYSNTYHRPIRAFGNPLPTTAKPSTSIPTSLKGGFRLQITNYTASCAWSVRATEGKAVVSASGAVVVSGLTPAQRSSVTVIKRCSGYQVTWNSRSGVAKA